jgi:creatinine amidohydrolase
MSTNDHDDMHAGELETSILLHSYPDIVGFADESSDWNAVDRPHLLMLGMNGYTGSGVIGRPSLGSPEKGKTVLDSLTRSFSNILTTLKSILGTR